MTTAARVIVAGRVQHVGFRWSATRAARERGVVGWVRNRLDGRVEAHVEGAPEAVESMVAWLARGPRGARVDVLERFDAEPGGATEFVTRRDGGR